MPLLDHFHPPLAPRRHWESFHVNWAGAMADDLNERLLPEGYFAEEHAQLGARVEIDVATFADALSEEPEGRPSGTTAVRSKVWTPPAPSLSLPAAFPDSFEVLIFEAEGVRQAGRGDRIGQSRQQGSRSPPPSVCRQVRELSVPWNCPADDRHCE